MPKAEGPCLLAPTRSDLEAPGSISLCPLSEAGEQHRQTCAPAVTWTALGAADLLSPGEPGLAWPRLLGLGQWDRSQILPRTPSVTFCKSAKSPKPRILIRKEET